MAKKPRLEIVGPTATNPNAPPAKLGKAGTSLWRSIMDEYLIDDSGGLALLTQACAAVDDIEACDQQITHDGYMVRGKFGPREHPLLRHQLALRAFVCRTLQRLGLNVEPSKPIGRPSGGAFGWRG